MINDNVKNNSALICYTTQDIGSGIESVEPSAIIDKIYEHKMQQTQHGAVVAEEKPMENTDEMIEIEMITSNEQSDLVSLDGNESDYSMPSLYGEAMQQIKNQELITKAEKKNSKKCNTEDTQSTMARGCDEYNKEIATIWVQINPLSSDASDSDDSIPSLYGECMGKSTKALRSTDNKEKRRELCPYCGLMTNQYIAHVRRRHMNEKKLECPHCLKKFAENNKLQDHINTWHERRIVFTCVNCGKGFANRGSYFSHMSNSHGKRDVYECKTCHRKLKSWDGYKKHLKEHALSTLKCDECGKLYKTMAMLEKHQLQSHHLRRLQQCVRSSPGWDSNPCAVKVVSPRVKGPIS